MKSDFDTRSLDARFDVRKTLIVVNARNWNAQVSIGLPEPQRKHVSIQSSDGRTPALFQANSLAQYTVRSTVYMRLVVDACVVT